MNQFKLFTALLFAGSMSVSATRAQDIDSTGLPGDNFSLQAAIDLFSKSDSPESFEKALNTGGNDVNNLDLNEDGETDYIKVIDKQDGDVHAFILQAAISETENQDIAVIELEKTGENTAVLQIVGDEDMYGEEIIVEPAGEESSAISVHSDMAYAHGPSAGIDEYIDDNPAHIGINVWLWPSVRFVYRPGYVIWTSPYRWRARPAWWHPFRPVRYSVFYPRRAAYRPRYVVVTTHRVVRARAIYRPARVTSVTVVHRNQANVTRYRAGRVTRTNTTVEGKHGRKVSRTKTTVRKRKR